MKRLHVMLANQEHYESYYCWYKPRISIGRPEGKLYNEIRVYHAGSDQPEFEEIIERKIYE